MKLTPFGKLVRHHRLHRDISLTMMCERIGVSNAFASAVETGVKKIPTGYPQKVSEALRLTAAEAEDLVDAADLSAPEVTIRLGRDASRTDRELVTMFARRFTNLPDQTKGDIRQLLGIDDE